MCAVASWAPEVQCELVRSVDDSVGYEARLTAQLDEIGGICTLEDLGAVAKVTNDIRYEWEIVTGVYPDLRWSV
jgi:hypothetical protein